MPKPQAKAPDGVTWRTVKTKDGRTLRIAIVKKSAATKKGK